MIGRSEVWDIHRKTAELGGNLRTGVEDTFYLANGDKVDGNEQVTTSQAKPEQEITMQVEKSGLRTPRKKTMQPA